MQQMRSMLSVEEALDRILAVAAPLPAEAASIEDAVGRAIAHEVRAGRTVPPWDTSAMDGFAVRSADVVRAPVRLRVIDTIYAGQTPARSIGPGQCSRVMTGAPLPSGADAVVMQERTEGRGEREVEILEPAAPGSFVRARGEDAREGDLLLALVAVHG